MKRTIKPQYCYKGELFGADGFFDDLSHLAVFPGFCDVHVHFREPGFSYKETIKSGSLSAAKGGFTSVCTMPNLNPVPDNLASLNCELDIIRRDAAINVVPYGAITKDEKGEVLSDMAEMSGYVCAFSDDGRGVQDGGVMKEAMLVARSLGKVIAAHCEDNSLLRGGYIHDGAYARAHGHKGICSKSEFCQIERDIALAKETKCAYHVCHISCRESVELIRQAKKDGIDITCETAPHYLVLSENDLIEDGKFKMNPPLRSEKDREALIEGVVDGTIDMIATDHAPHSPEEKSKGLSGSSFGVVGLETSFPVLYTHLVKSGVITLDRLVELMSVNPKKRFGIKADGFSVWNLGGEFTVDPNEFITLGRATPFDGMKLNGINLLTVFGGKTVYKNNHIKGEINHGKEN